MISIFTFKRNLRMISLIYCFSFMRLFLSFFTDSHQQSRATRRHELCAFFFCFKFAKMRSNCEWKCFQGHALSAHLLCTFIHKRLRKLTAVLKWCFPLLLLRALCFMVYSNQLWSKYLFYLKMRFWLLKWFLAAFPPIRKERQQFLSENPIHISHIYF